MGYLAEERDTLEGAIMVTVLGAMRRSAPPPGRVPEGNDGSVRDFHAEHKRGPWLMQ